MSKKKHSPFERWGTVGELVTELYGSHIKSICDAVTNYAKSRSLSEAIPKEFTRNAASSGPNPKQRFEYLISDRSKIFFGNLLSLDAVFPPRVVARLLAQEPLDKTATKQLDELGRDLAEKAALYTSFVASFPAIRDRMLRADIDYAAELLIPAAARAVDPSHRARIDLKSLGLWSRIETLERRLAESDSPQVRADIALLLIGLDEPDRATQVLDEAIPHPRVHYARAVIYLYQAARLSSEGRYASFQAREAGLSHEQYFEDEAMELLGDARDARRKALELLARALDQWPFEVCGNHRTWEDWQTREKAKGFLLKLAFEFAHDHLSVDMHDVFRLAARRQGVDFETYYEARRFGEPPTGYFGPDIDPVIVAIAKEEEKSYTPTSVSTQILQIYFAVSPREYERYRPLWLDQIERHPASSTIAWLRPRHVQNPLLMSLKEHLKRALEDADREGFLTRLWKRHAEELGNEHRELHAFIEAPPPSEDEESFEEF